MHLTRRDMLAATTAFSLTPHVSHASPGPVLKAGEGFQQLAPKDFAPTPIWGYDGTAPGPVIRAVQGARVKRRLINDLPQPTAVHWHGIRIDNAMDGVPGLTQPEVAPGGSFDYDFSVPDAGTYWYHSHNRTMEQVARGLYGALIIEEHTAPDVDHDLPLAIDDWRLDPETVQITDDFDNFHDLSHAGRMGNIVTVNGEFDPALPVARHDRMRLRLINAANARTFEIGLNGLEGWVMALDGMPLEEPLAVSGAFTLAPAQRVDLIVDVMAEPGETADLLSVERDGGYGLMRFPVSAGSMQRRGIPAVLPPNPLPEIADPANAPLHAITMQGGAMRGLPPSMLGATLLEPRELAQLGKFWALNGIVDRPDDPFVDLVRGETHRFAFVNETAFPHAMHLHGHHFRSITDNGSLGPWRDTVLVQPGTTQQIIMAADNPGKWLLHCHMLGHAAAGMMTWYNVTA